MDATPGFPTPIGVLHAVNEPRFEDLIAQVWLNQPLEHLAAVAHQRHRLRPVELALADPDRQVAHVARLDP